MDLENINSMKRTIYFKFNWGIFIAKGNLYILNETVGKGYYYISSVINGDWVIHIHIFNILDMVKIIAFY